MSDSTHELVEFVLERLPGEPLARRARLYRAIADVETHEPIIKRLREIADEIDDIEGQHQDLQTEFQNLCGVRRPSPTEARG